MRSVLFGGGFALLISLLGTRVAITGFTRIGAGQPIRDDGPIRNIASAAPRSAGRKVSLKAKRGQNSARAPNM